MKINVTFILKEAKSKLTRLGLALFYFYLLLVLVGSSGVIYGIITLILKVIHFNATFDSSLWEVIALIVASWFMAKIFLYESMSLIGKDISKQSSSHNLAKQETDQLNESDSKVIAFDRKYKKY